MRESSNHAVLLAKNELALNKRFLLCPNLDLQRTERHQKIAGILFVEKRFFTVNALGLFD